MTPTTTPTWDLLEVALRERRPVRLTYHGRQRVVCPHALGWKNDRAMLLAYQTSTTAGSADPRPGWRNFHLDEIDDPAPAGATTPWQTPHNYNAARPFNSIDRLSVAIAQDPPAPPVR